MVDLATISHLSDLHFVEKITEKGRAFYVPLFDPRAKPHAFEKVDALSLAFKTDVVPRIGKSDVTVITGDLTTNGSQGAFRTVLDYIQSRGIIIDATTGEEVTSGLGASGPELILTPGNHDRFARGFFGYQVGSKVFEELTKSSSFPYILGYRKDSQSNKRTEPAVIFFVFDTTLNSKSQINIVRKIAVGDIDDLSLDRLLPDVQRIIDIGRVKGLDGSELIVDYNKCVRIAILHHDPHERSIFMNLENSQKFIERCSDVGMDMVLYGHVHKFDVKQEYSKRPSPLGNVIAENHRTLYLRTASATECDSKNGFYIYKVSDCDVTIYRWNYLRQTGFKLEEPANQYIHTR